MQERWRAEAFRWKMLISSGACHVTDLVEHTELVANRIGTVIVSTKF